MMKRIVAKAGGGTDTTRDYEYTDWNDLRVFAHEFLNVVPVGELIEEESYDSGVACKKSSKAGSVRRGNGALVSLGT